MTDGQTDNNTYCKVMRS